MAEEKEKRVQEEDRRQAQIEQDLGGAPSTAAPDRSRPAAMKLQPIPDRFVPDHLSHLMGRSRLLAAVILGLERPQRLCIRPPH